MVRTVANDWPLAQWDVHRSPPRRLGSSRYQMLGVDARHPRGLGTGRCAGRRPTARPQRYLLMPMPSISTFLSVEVTLIVSLPVFAVV